MSALNFEINQSPSNDSCSIEPSMGTINTQFNVSCPEWFNRDEIKDYSLCRSWERIEWEVNVSFSLLVWSAKLWKRTLLAFSSIATFPVRLSSGSELTFSLELLVYIRDTWDCLTEWNRTSIVVRPDPGNNFFTELLKTGNPNTIGQVITSLSLNKSTKWTRETSRRRSPVILADHFFASIDSPRWNSCGQYLRIIVESFSNVIERPGFTSQLGHGWFQQRIELSSKSACLSDGISHRSASHADLEQHSKLISSVSAINCSDESIDSKCSGKDLFVSSVIWKSALRG